MILKYSKNPAMPNSPATGRIVAKTCFRNNGAARNVERNVVEEYVERPTDSKGFYRRAFPNIQSDGPSNGPVKKAARRP